MVLKTKQKIRINPMLFVIKNKIINLKSFVNCESCQEKRIVNFVTSICHLQILYLATPNSNICSGYASEGGGGGGGETTLPPAKFCSLTVEEHGRPPSPGIHVQLFGAGGLTGRRCNDGSRRFWPLFIHCSSSSSRILAPSYCFVHNRKNSIIVAKINF